ncbi:MAG: ribosomal L7Ae/L30e/S12e/Gadd45 family protein [Nitrososphaeria archaeon]|nr:ribosomal L7Ae/L30e/S12e/Gadd45 family protein [Nitrososphaeria archaeon]
MTVQNAGLRKGSGNVLKMGGSSGARAGSAMDVKTELRVLRRTGKVVFGFRQSYLALMRGEASVVLVSSDCPERFRRELQVAAAMKGAKVVDAGVSSSELSRLLGKPFHASTVAVIDAGSSNLGKG